MQISSATVIGFLVGVAAGIVSIGQVVALSPSRGHHPSRCIVDRCVEYVSSIGRLLTGVRTALLRVVTRHPFRNLAGFFAGLSVGLGLFLLLSPRLVSTLPSQS